VGFENPSEAPTVCVKDPVGDSTGHETVYSDDGISAAGSIVSGLFLKIGHVALFLQHNALNALDAPIFVSITDV